MLDIFLAGPDDLHGAVDVLRDLNGTRDAVAFEPAPEAAPDEMVVDHDLVQRQSRNFRRRRLGSRDGLGADPNVATILADMDRAVHRLQCGVRQKRDLVDRVNSGGGARHCLVSVTNILRNRTETERRLFQLSRDVRRAEFRVWSVIPLDHQGCQPLLRGPHVIGHDRDGIVEPHNLAHAFDGFCRRVVEALDEAAENRRLRQRRDLHARWPRIDTEYDRTVDLARCVETLGWSADEPEIFVPLEHYIFGNRLASSISGELAVSDTPARRDVQHFTALRAAGRGVDVPAACRGRH